MANEKQEFEQQLQFISKGALWYVLPITLLLTGVLGYMAISMGTVFNSTQWTLIILTLVFVVVDGLLFSVLKKA
ncbi:MAG: hypothetical protein ACRC6H_07685 [Culicoidibacterales bacterium]